MSERPKSESSRRAPIINPELVETNKPLEHKKPEPRMGHAQKMEALAQEEQLRQERIEKTRALMEKAKGDARAVRREKTTGFTESSKKISGRKAPLLPEKENV